MVFLLTHDASLALLSCLNDRAESSQQRQQSPKDKNTFYQVLDRKRMLAFAYSWIFANERIVSSRMGEREGRVLGDRRERDGEGKRDGRETDRRERENAPGWP